MRFFLDNNLPPRLARAIKALMENDGDSVVHLTDMFQSGTSDVEWISKLAAQRDWIIISGDLRITKSPHERKVRQQAKLTTFFSQGGGPS